MESNHASNLDWKEWRPFIANTINLELKTAGSRPKKIKEGRRYVEPEGENQKVLN